MTEFEPPASATPQPLAVPAATTGYVPPPARARKGPPWWVWLIVAGGVLTVGMVVSGVLVFLGQAQKGYSEGYSGTPVEASDASATTVVSADATVAYEVGSGWVDATTVVPVAEVEAQLLPGQDFVGAHFTSDPATTTPQIVFVISADSGQFVAGSLESAMEGYLDGMRASGTTFDDPPLSETTTSIGLEGVEASFEPEFGGQASPSQAGVFGHGGRLVFVQWISYDGPIDSDAYATFIESLRVDK